MEAGRRRIERIAERLEGTDAAGLEILRLAAEVLERDR